MNLKLFLIIIVSPWSGILYNQILFLSTNLRGYPKHI
jgi:hypothetical protein